MYKKKTFSKLDFIDRNILFFEHIKYIKLFPYPYTYVYVYFVKCI